MVLWSLATSRHIWGLTVRAGGELDSSTADDLVMVVEGFHVPGETLELDLSGLTFCDSFGLAALVRVKAHVVNDDGILFLSGLTAPVRRVLDITGLDQEFTIVRGGIDPTGGVSVAQVRRLRVQGVGSSDGSVPSPPLLQER